jgi:hypothetical protein
MSLPAFALTSPDAEEVFLAAEDLVAYDWARHRLELRPGAKARLAGRLIADLAAGRPFALLAGGQRIYEGVFTSSMSSSTQSGVVIDLAPVDDDPCRVDLQLGYPSPAFFRGTDPRDDPRVRAALAGLNKLR